MTFLKFWESKEKGAVIVSLGYQDLLLESVRLVARELDIHTGVLMTGIGSLNFGHIHAVVTNDVPPRDEFYKLPGPLEVASFGGVIANYEPCPDQQVFPCGPGVPVCAAPTLLALSFLRRRRWL